MEKYKIISIISIVINVIFVLLFMWAVSVGSEMVEQDIECSVNVCSMDNAVSYWYDEYTEICSCFDVFDNEIHTEYLG